MRLTYDITFEDFRSLFPPTTSIRKSYPQLYAAIVFAGFFTVVGVLILLKALDILTSESLPIGTPGAGLALIGLGALVIAFCVAYEKYLNRKLQKSYETSLLARFKQQHCPKNRIVESTPDGIQTRCGCGTFNHPWSEVSAFDEDSKFFRLKAGKDVIVLPQRIFASPAQKGEFRLLVSKALGQTSSNTGLRVQFVYTKGDRRNARLLHIAKGMSLKEKLQLSGALALFIGLLASVPLLAVRFPYAAMGVTLPVVFVIYGIYKTASARQHSLGTVSASISWSGIELKDRSGVASESWKVYSGYVEGQACWLLYYKTNRYRIFPKRAFQPNQRLQFQQMVSSSLPLRAG